MCDPALVGSSRRAAGGDGGSRLDARPTPSLGFRGVFPEGSQDPRKWVSGGAPSPPAPPCLARAGRSALGEAASGGPGSAPVLGAAARGSSGPPGRGPRQRPPASRLGVPGKVPGGGGVLRGGARRGRGRPGRGGRVGLPAPPPPGKRRAPRPVRARAAAAT